MLAGITAIRASRLSVELCVPVEVNFDQFGDVDVRFRLPVLDHLANKVIADALRVLGGIFARF
ncbi:hypothetical protein [Kibdelosporangium aridum]|uniref:hypothetical protein n=1 Tax=Kibdelosporangium aridum TaxID=2030 RepID=UPI0035EAA53B